MCHFWRKKDRHVLTGQSIRDVTYKEPWCSLKPLHYPPLYRGEIMLRLQRPSFGPWRNTAFSEWKAFETQEVFFCGNLFQKAGAFFFWEFVAGFGVVVVLLFWKISADFWVSAPQIWAPMCLVRKASRWRPLERVGEKRCAAVFLQTWVMQIHHATDRSLATLKKAQEIAHNITNNITKHHFFPHFLLAFFVEICLFFKSFVFFFTQIYFDQTDSVEQQEVLPMAWLRLSGQEWRASFSCMGFYEFLRAHLEVLIIYTNYGSN